MYQPSLRENVKIGIKGGGGGGLSLSIIIKNFFLKDFGLTAFGGT